MNDFGFSRCSFNPPSGCCNAKNERLILMMSLFTTNKMTASKYFLYINKKNISVFINQMLITAKSLHLCACKKVKTHLISIFPVIHFGICKRRSTFVCG